MVESAGPTAQSRLAISIVEGALVGIAQHVVGLGYRLEFLLGVLRPVVAIRVVRHRLLAIRSLYFCIAGATMDAKRVVIISHVLWNSPSTNQSLARRCESPTK